MADYYAPIAFLVLIAFLLGVMIVSARRFARRRRREGVWNAEGPVHPTPPPPDWLLPEAWRGRPPVIEPDDDEPTDPTTHT